METSPGLTEVVLRQSLIAVNYAARKFGVTRQINITEARKLCPQLIAQHVATWREGENSWAYRVDAAANIARDKVSLDPYRFESRKILAAMKEALPPPPLQRVEKAGIDEVFLDLSAQVHSIMLVSFPVLSAAMAPGADPSERLPPPPITALDWNSDHLVELDEAEEIKDPDWDDIALSIGADIIREVRARVREKLNYTCSGGISHNKLLSKLGSAQNKPNKQTVIRGRAVARFLAPIKFTKMRNLGGKLGDQVALEFNTEDINQLLTVPLSSLKSRLGQKTGLWVYNTIRGIDGSEVNPRTTIKSMLSAKSFRPPIHTRAQAEQWIKIFAADIFSRLVEEGILENRRRPKTVNLHVRHNNLTRSRQIQIPPALPLDELALMNMGSSLLTQIMSEGEVWPCLHMNMSVSGLEDGIKDNMPIGLFFTRGDRIPILKDSVKPHDAAQPSEGLEPPRKAVAATDDLSRKRRRSDVGSIVTDGSELETYRSHPVILRPGSTKGGTIHPKVRCEVPGDVGGSRNRSQPEYERVSEADHRCPSHFSQTAADDQQLASSYACSRCKISFGNPTDLQSHNDWHVAVDLQEREARVEERVRLAFAGRESSRCGRQTSAKPGKPSGRLSTGGSGGSSSSSTSRRGGGRGGKPDLEPGQRRLNFG